MRTKKSKVFLVIVDWKQKQVPHTNDIRKMLSREQFTLLFKVEALQDFPLEKKANRIKDYPYFSFNY